MNDPVEVLIGGALFFSIIIMAIMIPLAIIEDIKKQQFLEKNGCQIIKEVETGRSFMSGKILRHEIMRLYECANGDKIELGT